MTSILSSLSFRSQFLKHERMMLLGAPLLQPVEDALARKLDAVACYASQLPVIFRFTDDFRAALAAYARGLHPGGVAVERFWPVLPG